MNKWKIYFWACLSILIFVSAFFLYTGFDQGVSLTYMQEGYADTNEDFSSLIKIINETDLTKGQIRTSLTSRKDFELLDFKSDTVSLNRITMTFKNDKLNKIETEW